jgi:ribose 5-phosphate isomerase B
VTDEAGGAPPWSANPVGPAYGFAARLGTLDPNLRSAARIAPMRIAIASDHAALDLKAELREYLIELGHEVADLGPDTADSVDYPDYGYKLASVIADGTAERGVALCGSGIGISMAVNRNPACRCARVSEPLSAALSREHNDANVIAMGARLIGLDMAKACLDAFLSTDFGGDRHVRRVGKLSNPPVTRPSASETA